MYKFALFIDNCGYNKYIYDAAKKESGLVPGLYSEIERKLVRYHNAYPLNKKRELPAKMVWYKKYLDESQLSRDDKICFVFYESFSASYSRKYMTYLKSKYVNSIFFFVFTNPVSPYNHNRLSLVRDCFDYILTFNRKDAEKYHYYLNLVPLLELPDVDEDTQYASDVFFVGSDKGRLDLILEIYEYLTEKGVKCSFYITDVNKKDMKYTDNIVYNKRITYEEVLKRDKAAKCILEILQNDYSYRSLRTIEAIKYNKKLLTTNLEIEQDPLFNPNMMRSFQSADQIDVDFILEQCNSIDNAESVSNFQKFKKYLISIIEGEERPL